MRCAMVKKLSTRYLDGELDVAQASAIRGHMRLCGDCKALVDDEAAIVAAAAKLGESPVPESLWRSVQVGIANAEIADSRRSRLWFWWRGTAARFWPHAVGASMAAAVIAFYLMRLSSPETEVVPPRTAATTTITGPSMSFAEARLEEAARADARYRQVLQELEQALAEERRYWSVDDVEAFEAELAALEASAGTRQGTLVGGDATANVGTHLFIEESERAELMQRCAVGELSWQ
jgi:hypothetical protein